MLLSMQLRIEKGLIQWTSKGEILLKRNKKTLSTTDRVFLFDGLVDLEVKTYTDTSGGSCTPAKFCNNSYKIIDLVFNTCVYI